MAVTAEETFRRMRGVAEAAGWRVDAEPSSDGSMRVTLSPTVAVEVPLPPMKPLLAEEVVVAARGVVESVDDIPTLSVLFGTYQRFESLQRAVESVRASASGITYEVIVCDGGSSDGSREWLAAQPDVVLVAKRSLDGAVDAFNHCYRLARGRYIANFNDDAVYQGRALAVGVEHLEKNPRVGQAVFAFRGAGEDYVINEIYPGHLGTEYANFGIARREVIEEVVEIQGGYWNPIYRTYAADCEQSAWIHRLGWEVARLEDERIADLRTKDDLRKTNESRQGGETKLMYYRWPLASFAPGGPPPRVGDAHAVDPRGELARFDAVKRRGGAASPPAPRSTASVYAEVVGFPLPREEDRILRQAAGVRQLDPVEGQFPKRADRLGVERVLYVSLATEADPQAGLDWALRRLGSGGFEEVKWYAEYGSDPARRRTAILDVAARLKPTVVFMQLQVPNAVTVETVQEIRRIVGDPRLVVLTWTGDIADVNSPWKLDWMAPLGRACDLTLHSSMSHVRVLRSLGVHNAAYLQIGYDPEQYRTVDYTRADDRSVVAKPWVPLGYDFSVCFLGSRYDGDVFSRSLKWHDARLRNDAVLALAEAFGDRFGLFGRGWGRVEHVVPLNRAHEVYWRSRIGLNVSLMNNLECYSSDRLFRIMGCGALALTKSFPGMSSLGLVDDENCVVWETPAEAVAKAREILAALERLRAVAGAGAKLVRENHTWDVRMLELAPLLAAARGE